MLWALTRSYFHSILRRVKWYVVQELTPLESAGGNYNNNNMMMMIELVSLCDISLFQRSVCSVLLCVSVQPYDELHRCGDLRII